MSGITEEMNRGIEAASTLVDHARKMQEWDINVFGCSIFVVKGNIMYEVKLERAGHCEEFGIPRSSSDGA